MGKDIFIEFTRPKGIFKPLSHTIRLVEGTPYSHVRLRWDTGVGVNVVYEAGGTSVKFLGPLAQKHNPVVIIKSHKIHITDQEYKHLLALCMKNAGLSYGFLQLVGILFVKLFNLKKNPLSNGRKSQVCSELVGRFLQEILNVGLTLNLDIAGPKDIYNELELYKNL